MHNFAEIINKKEKILLTELDEVFSTLQPVTIDELIGEWEIGYLNTEDTGSKLDTIFKKSPIKLFSKKFIAEGNVKAWVFRVWGIKFSLPISDAVLKSEEYRNMISTSMHYKHMPFIDYFRKVDNDTVMGIMEDNGKVSGYFYLTRLA